MNFYGLCLVTLTSRLVDVTSVFTTEWPLHLRLWPNKQKKQVSSACQLVPTRPWKTPINEYFAARYHFQLMYSYFATVLSSWNWQPVISTCSKISKFSGLKCFERNRDYSVAFKCFLVFSSRVNIINRRGLRMQPCGTPLSTLHAAWTTLPYLHYLFDFIVQVTVKPWNSGYIIKTIVRHLRENQWYTNAVKCMGEVK